MGLGDLPCTENEACRISPISCRFSECGTELADVLLIFRERRWIWPFRRASAGSAAMSEALPCVLPLRNEVRGLTTSCGDLRQVLRIYGGGCGSAPEFGGVARAGRRLPLRAGAHGYTAKLTAKGGS